MHFPLLVPAYLVTILGLVSVACAAPGKLPGRPPTWTLTFLNQDKPVESIGKPSGGQAGDKLPEKFEKFFDLPAVREGLNIGHSNKIYWSVFAQDHTYLRNIANTWPVYAQFKGGQWCQAVAKCVATVVDDAHGMVTRASTLVIQVGNPAIVSFTNWGEITESSEEDHIPISLSEDKVYKFLNKAEVKKELGFTGEPKIAHVDTIPKGDPNQLLLTFHLYGGTRCMPRRSCKVSMEYKTGPGDTGTYTAQITAYDGQRIGKELTWTSW